MDMNANKNLMRRTNCHIFTLETSICKTNKMKSEFVFFFLLFIEKKCRALMIMVVVAAAAVNKCQIITRMNNSFNWKWEDRNWITTAETLSRKLCVFCGTHVLSAFLSVFCHLFQSAVKYDAVRRSFRLELMVANAVLLPLCVCALFIFFFH